MAFDIVGLLVCCASLALAGWLTLRAWLEARRRARGRKIIERLQP